MITTTFKQLRDFEACISRYNYLAKALGKNHGDETPITLWQVFDICGFDDARWLVRNQSAFDCISPFKYKKNLNLIHLWDREMRC